MTSEALTDASVRAKLISHQPALSICSRENDTAQGGGGHVIDLTGTYPATTLDESDNWHSISASASPPSVLGMQEPSRTTFLVHGVTLVRLDDLAFATQRARAAIDRHHSFANAVSNEPSGFEIDAEHAAQLISAETFLAGAHQVHRLQPDVHRHMALFEDRSDLDGEWLPAGIALIDANASAPALQRPTLINHATMGADTPIRPHDRLDVCV